MRRMYSVFDLFMGGYVDFFIVIASRHMWLKMEERQSGSHSISRPSNYAEFFICKLPCRENSVSFFFVVTTPFHTLLFVYFYIHVNQFPSQPFALQHPKKYVNFSLQVKTEFYICFVIKYSKKVIQL